MILLEQLLSCLVLPPALPLLKVKYLHISQSSLMAPLCLVSLFKNCSSGSSLIVRQVLLHTEKLSTGLCACFLPQGPPGGGGPPGTPIMPSPGGTVDLFCHSPFCISFTHSLSPRLYNRHSRKQFVSLQERKMLSTSQTPYLTPSSLLPYPAANITARLPAFPLAGKQNM